MTDDELIAAFVDSWELDAFFDDADPPPTELWVATDLDSMDPVWRPARIDTPHEALAKLRSDMRVKLPPLFERLLLTWRWCDMSIVDKVRLFANPPGYRLDDFQASVFRDPVFNGHLIARGYIPFGFDNNRYDPVCFDTNVQHEDGDCLIRKFEHEAMLSFNRIGESWVLWPSCRAMMMESIDRA